MRPRADGFRVQLCWAEEEEAYVGHDEMCGKDLRIGYKNMNAMLELPGTSLFLNR